MKIYQVSMLVCTLLTLLLGTASAQAPNKMPTTTPQAGPSAAVTDDPNAQPPFCDVAIPKALEELQKAAEASCKTGQTCIPCTDRTTGTTLYATLYAQPKDTKCNVVSSTAYETIREKDKMLRGVQFEILQAVCTREGVSLEVSLPDASIDLRQYNINWEVDGRAAGSGINVNCVCGKTASVTLTEKTTGRQAKKQVRLTVGCNTSKN